MTGMIISYQTDKASSGLSNLETSQIGAQLKSKRKASLLNRFKCSILYSCVTLGWTWWYFYGPCTKDGKVITDGNVRYRYTVNKVRVIGVYVVNKSICGAGYSRGLCD